MPNIREYETPNLRINPSETGVEATAMAARRIGLGSNQQAGALRGLAGETEQFGRETQGLGRETAEFGRQQQQYGRDVESLGAYKERALDDIGRRVGSAVADAGDVAVKYETHQQISHGAATFATLRSDLEDRADDALKNADPHDRSVAGNFTENVVNPSLDKFRDAFGTDEGQRWAETHIEALRAHISDKMMAGMSNNAATAVHQDWNNLFTTDTNTARNHPESVPSILATGQTGVASIVSSSPNLRGDVAQKTLTELTDKYNRGVVRAGALGAIERSADPEHAWQGWASRYPDWIDSQEMGDFAKSARQFAIMNRAEARNNREDQEHKARLDLNQKALDLEAQTLPKKPGDAPTLPDDYWDKVRELHTHPGAALEPAVVNGLITKGEAITERLNKPEPLGRVSHDTTMDLLGQIRQGKVPDNGPIYQAYQDGKLNRVDFSFLINEHSNLKTPEGEALGKDRDQFFKSYASAIDPGRDQATGAGASALGTQKIYAAEMDARRQEQNLRSKGLDPHLVYDPSSQYFLGRQISKYRPTVSEQNAYDAQVAADKARKPGANLGTVTGETVQDIPAGMSPADAMKQYKSGTKLRLPDGRIGTVP